MRNKAILSFNFYVLVHLTIELGQGLAGHMLDISPDLTHRAQTPIPFHDNVYAFGGGRRVP